MNFQRDNPNPNSYHRQIVLVSDHSTFSPVSNCEMGDRLRANNHLAV